MRVIVFIMAFLGFIDATCKAAGEKWEQAIRQFEDADRQKAPPSDAFLFIGSSSIEKWKDLAADFPGVPVINRGFGGSEIADSTQYAERIIAPYRPRLILLYAGDNDIANRHSAAEVAADYHGFVKKVRALLPTTRIAYISIKPSPARAGFLEEARAANGLIKEEISKDPSEEYIDIFTPMLGTDGQPRAELFGPDRLHMNRAGYDLWKGIILPYLK